MTTTREPVIGGRQRIGETTLAPALDPEVGPAARALLEARDRARGGCGAALRVFGTAAELHAWARRRTLATLRSELLAVTRWCGTIDDFLPRHETHQQLAARGVRQVQVFDEQHLRTHASPGVVPFLTRSRDVAYRLGEAPLQVEVMDRSQVLMPADEHGTAMHVLHGEGVVAAAVRYVRAVPPA